MAHSSTLKEARKTVKAAKKAGWDVEETTDGWKFSPPGGAPPIYIHFNGGSRTRKNYYTSLKRAGLDLNA